MNKKFINGLLLATLLVGSAGTFTSCKDYDDDINDLQGQIDGVIKSIGELQEKIKNGAVIDNVTSNDDGLVITINGKNYTITNGKNGENGAPGTSWSIGANGNWYKDGEDTGLKAVADAGAAGEQGPQGPAGPTGPQGPAGKYYVPNEDGYFWIHEEGKDPEKTNISWVAAGPTAAFTGTELILSGLKDADGKTLDPVTIPLGTNITSIAFIPDELVGGVPAASFWTLANKSIDVAGTGADKDWKVGKEIAASNDVVLNYRLNPSDAFVAPTASVAYINRQVKSRAAGDANNLLKGAIVASETEDALAVSTSINYSVYKDIVENKDKSGKTTPLAALQLTNGQKTFTSDYILVEAGKVTAKLVDKAKTAKNKAAYTSDLYNRTKKEAASDQTSTQYISQFVKGTIEYAEELAYDGSLDLSTIPALYVDGKGFLEDLGFDNVKFEYILPGSYNIGNTDQQYFVQLNGTILSVKDNIGGKSQAIGRTPVVLINAYVGDNLVATAYVVIKIVSATGTKEDINITIPGKDAENYVNLPAPNSVKPGNTNYLMGELGWQAINSQIYGALGLTSESFDDNYNAPVVNVYVPVTWKENNQTKTGTAVYAMSNSGANYTNTNLPGLIVNADLTASATTTTAPIQIWTNNLIHTQDGQLNNVVLNDGKNTQVGTAQIAGTGAAYTIEVVYASKTPATRGDVVLSKTITITETHEALIYSNFVKNGKVESFGALNDNKYEMMFNLTNAFKRGDNNTDIFSYLNGTNTIANVKGITITDVVLPTKKINDVKTILVNALDANGAVVTIPENTKANAAAYAAACEKVRKLEVANPAGLTNLPTTASISFVLELANGELCQKDYTFDIEFKNPFVGTKGAGLTLNGNAPLASPLDVKPQILVNDHSGNKIYSWEATAWNKDGVATAWGLVLSDVAKSATGYAVDAAPALSYAFDKASQDYINGMGAGKLEVKADGTIEYVPGAVLQESKTLNINVTATFQSGAKTFSIVVCTVPLTVNAGN